MEGTHLFRLAGQAVAARRAAVAAAGMEVSASDSDSQDEWSDGAMGSGALPIALPALPACDPLADG